MPEYTDADRRADQLAVTRALLPVVDPVLAEMGLSRGQAMALMEAGEPPPARVAVSPDRPRPVPAMSPSPPPTPEEAA